MPTRVRKKLIPFAEEALKETTRTREVAGDDRKEHESSRGEDDDPRGDYQHHTIAKDHQELEVANHTVNSVSAKDPASVLR